MWLIFLLAVISLTRADDSNCVFSFDNQTYSRTVALVTIGTPLHLAYDPNHSHLYFNLYNQFDEFPIMNIYRMDFKTNEVNIIDIDDVNPRAAVVDPENRKLYVATRTGLKVLNETGDGKFQHVNRLNVMFLFKYDKQDKLLITTYPTRSVYAVDTKTNTKTNKTKKVKGIKALQLAVDNNNFNIYYINNQKEVKMKPPFGESKTISEIPKDHARHITVDGRGRVILAANDGLYHLNTKDGQPMKMMDLEFVPTGLLFVCDDIYIATYDVIYKYTKLPTDQDSSGNRICRSEISKYSSGVIPLLIDIK